VSETQIVGDLSAKGNRSKNNNKSDEKEEQAGSRENFLYMAKLRLS